MTLRFAAFHVPSTDPIPKAFTHAAPCRRLSRTSVLDYNPSTLAATLMILFIVFVLEDNLACFANYRARRTPNEGLDPGRGFRRA